MAASTQAIRGRVHTQSQALANLQAAQSSGEIANLIKNQSGFLSARKATGQTYLNSLDKGGIGYTPSSKPYTPPVHPPGWTPKVFYGANGQVLHGIAYRLASFQSRLPWLSNKAKKSGDTQASSFFQSLEY